MFSMHLRYLARSTIITHTVKPLSFGSLVPHEGEEQHFIGRRLSPFRCTMLCPLLGYPCVCGAGIVFNSSRLEELRVKLVVVVRVIPPRCLEGWGDDLTSR